MRQSLGTAVFSGMLGVTLFGLFLTPVFYVVLRRRRKRSLRPSRTNGSAHDDGNQDRNAPERSAFTETQNLLYLLFFTRTENRFALFLANCSEHSARWNHLQTEGCSRSKDSDDLCSVQITHGAWRRLAFASDQ